MEPYRIVHMISMPYMYYHYGVLDSLGEIWIFNIEGLVLHKCSKNSVVQWASEGNRISAKVFFQILKGFGEERWEEKGLLRSLEMEGWGGT